ncbi:unnamed protein product, partial [Gordionus sp. m RMFG-2023]
IEESDNYDIFEGEDTNDIPNNIKNEKSNLIQLTLDETDYSKVKRVQKNRPKFNTNLLLGEKGLSALSNIFQNIKLKGYKNEKTDLNTILDMYEHWALRLFPKYSFEDVIDKIENLGHKNVVKTTLHNMHQLFKDELNSQRMSNNENDHNFNIEFNEDINLISNLDNSLIKSTITQKTDHDEMGYYEEINSENTHINDNEEDLNENIQTLEPVLSLSCDLKKRIEKNRLLALEKRKYANNC